MRNNSRARSIIELFRSPNLQSLVGIEREFRYKINAVWKRAARLSGEELEVSCPMVCVRLEDKYVKDAMQACNAMACELGMDELDYGKKIEKKSKVFSDHFFKVGLFFDGQGAESFSFVMQQLGLKTMDEIFGRCPKGEKLQFCVPDWGAALLRCAEEKAKLKRMYLEKQRVLDYRVVTMVFNLENERQEVSSFVLSEYVKDYLSKVDEGQGGTEEIVLYGEETIEGVVLKKEGDRLVVCLIVKTKEFYIWYLEALEVIQETIEFVLSQKRVEEYYLLWKEGNVEVEF